MQGKRPTFHFQLSWGGGEPISAKLSEESLYLQKKKKYKLFLFTHILSLPQPANHQQHFVCLKCFNIHSSAGCNQ
jgi:hypothetical protein